MYGGRMIQGELVVQPPEGHSEGQQHSDRPCRSPASGFAVCLRQKSSPERPLTKPWPSICKWEPAAVGRFHRLSLFYRFIESARKRGALFRGPGQQRASTTAAPGCARSPDRHR
jgi:hypothetical protein